MKVIKASTIIIGLTLILCVIINLNDESYATVETIEEPEMGHVTNVEAHELSQEDIIRYFYINNEDIQTLANVCYGEAHLCPTTTEKAAVIWCVLNRLDYGWGDNIYEVVTAEGQFDGYYRGSDLIPPHEYELLAEDVLLRYYMEKLYNISNGRVLPKEYQYFMGDCVAHNYFTIGYHEGSLQYCINNAWNWSLESPYDR